MNRDTFLSQLNDTRLSYTNIALDAKEVDLETLHADMKADLGDKFIGLSTASCDDGDFVIIHLDKNSTGGDRSKARQKFDAHDIATIPPKPVVKSDKERITELEALVATLMEARGMGAQSAK